MRTQAYFLVAIILYLLLPTVGAALEIKALIRGGIIGWLFFLIFLRIIGQIGDDLSTSLIKVTLRHNWRGADAPDKYLLFLILGSAAFCLLL